MLGTLKRIATETGYRLKIRKALQIASLEELNIMREELIKEQNHRTKQRNKKR